MTGLNWHLDTDRMTVTLTLPSNPPGSFKLDGARIDELLENLGRFRAAMKPPFAPTIAPRKKFSCIRKPVWFTEPDVMLGDSLLHVRDPRFGWLHYLIPREDARKLAGFLQAQVDAPSPTQSKGKPN